MYENISFKDGVSLWNRNTVFVTFEQGFQRYVFNF